MSMQQTGLPLFKTKLNVKRWGETPLGCSLKRGHNNIAKLLKKHGAKESFATSKEFADHKVISNRTGSDSSRILTRFKKPRLCI
jgi:hypothetical protein